MTREAFLSFCAGLEGALLDRPFRDDPDTVVARHERNRKWFAILMRAAGREFVNLKCRPAEGSLLRGMFGGIRPAYHMNKEHWISVDLQGDVPREVIHRLVTDSHRLTAPRLRGRRPDRPTDG